MKPLVVTVYVPLCAEQCTFCHKLTCPSTLSTVNRYTQALLAEIDAVAPDLEGYEIATVRFTGGTPLLLGGTNVANVLNRLRKQLPFADNAEITVETVTDKLDEYNLQVFQRFGINRLEVFAPTLVGDEHRRLQAPGDYGHLSILDTMRKHYGLDNWGVHLLYGFEDQTEATWERTLQKAVALAPRSIRLEAAVLGSNEDGSAEGEHAVATDAAAHLATLRQQAVVMLTEHGYEEGPLEYWVLPGSTPQWATLVAQGADQLGLGAGMASRWDGYYYRNTAHIGHYMAHADDPEQVIVEAAVCE